MTEKSFHCHILVLALCIALSLSAKLIQTDGYQNFINGVSYGDNSIFCRQSCKRGEMCIRPIGNKQNPICTAKCGDGIVVGVEAAKGGCDDGNKVVGDGCSSCVVEKGWSCSNKVGSPSVCVPICGDGFVLETPKIKQECDDGNKVVGDGCTNCVADQGWTCTNDLGGLSKCTQVCGDGIVVGTEAESGKCDDGNIGVGDGCTNCVVDQGWTCSGSPSLCINLCGNKVLDSGEECDNGFINQYDGCSQECKVQNGWSCSTLTNGTSDCVYNPLNYIQPEDSGSAQCNDNNQIDGDGCSAVGKIQEGYTCITNFDGISYCYLDCHKIIMAKPYLGNFGYVNNFCYDYNNIDGDGCTKCQPDTDYLCMPNSQGGGGQYSLNETYSKYSQAAGSHQSSYLANGSCLHQCNYLTIFLIIHPIYLFIYFPFLTIILSLY